MSDGLLPLLANELSEAAALEESTLMPKKCNVCKKEFCDPVILSCLHIFDRECLRAHEKHDELVPYIKCPTCEAISGCLKTLPSYDVTLVNLDKAEGTSGEDPVVQCSVCTDGNEALYRCLHCAGTLCERCRSVHKVMKLFSHHEILILTEEEKKNSEVLQRMMQNAKPVPCCFHPESMYSSFCVQCHVPLCDACVECDHKGHVLSSLDSIPEHVDSLVRSLTEVCVPKQKALKELTDVLHGILSDVSQSRDRNKCSINDTYNQWKIALDAVKEQFLLRNSELHDELEMKIWSRMYKIGETIDHIDYACQFVRTYLKRCSNVEMCRLTKNIVACFDRLSKTKVAAADAPHIRFESSLHSVLDIVQQEFGKIQLKLLPERELCTVPLGPEESQAIPGGPICGLSTEFKRLNLKSDGSTSNGSLLPIDSVNCEHLNPVTPTDNHNSNRDGLQLAVPYKNGSLSPFASQRGDQLVISRSGNNWIDANVELPYFGEAEFVSTAPPIDTLSMHSHILTSEFDQSILRPVSTIASMQSFEMDQSPLKPKLPANYATSLYEYCRMRSARCCQMNLLTKWGSLGCELGRLNSPHGFCLGFDEEIVIADTNNHRIQIFTKRGDFVSFFGVSGRVDGLLWYPRKVAIIRHSQRYVVCDRGNERSRMQLFSRSGHFVRRIPIRYIEIVAGLAINQNGHIVAIDSVSPSLFVISEEGNLLHWFDCSDHMREPSDVAVHGREYYICDFKAHRVIVFQEDGTFIRRIGGETITDFPNGIDVSDHGDVLVGDSHGNRFHVAVFSRTGELLSEFVCNQTKVSRSCCLKITTEGYVVTLARNSNNVLVLDTLYICQGDPAV